jgi:hypothetical protein
LRVDDPPKAYRNWVAISDRHHPHHAS